tara:strand:+ start:126 stop:371 length:246 start_codon:yes stop_codon:yes gene_type:complete
MKLHKKEADPEKGPRTLWEEVGEVEEVSLSLTNGDQIDFCEIRNADEVRITALPQGKRILNMFSIVINLKEGKVTIVRKPV